ncbi:MAG TPA: ABC transporter permease [Acidimicrobiales bacterium]|nr:ABC transporter permease [Acidimicrobiales bacterium]
MTSTRRTQVIVGAVVVVYVVWSLIGGDSGWLGKKAPIGIVLAGVVYGSVYALGAFGLILIYRTNRIINFAHGALGSLVGVLAIGLVKEHGLNYWIALPAAVVGGFLVGGITEVGVIRNFNKKKVPRLILTVATIGLATAFGGLEILGSKRENFTSLTGAFSPPFNVSLRISVSTFHSAEILIVLIVPVVIAFLAWFLLRTKVGIAVRAAAENEDRALLLGIPVRRLATIVWAIAGSLAVLTYMLSAPFEGVKPGITSNGPTVLLPLLAAAVVARMESLPTAFFAGIGLGIAEQLVHWNAPNHPSLIYVVYLAVILIALMAQSGRLSRAYAGATSSWASVAALKPIPEELRGVPEVRWGKRGLLALTAAAFIFIPAMWGPSNQLLASYAIVWAIVGVSLVVLTGWGGNMSLGQFGIAGISAMVAANMVSHWNADFFFVILAAGATGALVAVVIGLPALRIKGMFLGVTTLALAVALDLYFLNSSNFSSWIPSSGVDRPLLLQRFDLNDQYTMYLVCLAFLLVTILVTMGLRKARAGRVMIAAENNDRAAQAASVDTTRVKLAGFAVSGVIAGIAGALTIYLLTALNPGSFPAIDSITVFGYSVIGGLGSVAGVIIGVLFFKYIETITALGQYHLVISGISLLWVLSVVPGGIGQVVYGVRDRILRGIANRRGILVPSLVADRRVEGEADHAEDEESLLAGALTAPAIDEVEGNGKLPELEGVIR